MTAKARIQPGDGDSRHGSANGYNNLGCRCVDCTGAWAEYYRRCVNFDPLRKPAARERVRRARREAGEA